MKYIKSYKIFESRIDDMEDIIKDILIELEDQGLQIEINRISKDVDIDPERYFGKTRTEVYLEIRIMRPWNSPNRVIPGAPQPPGGSYPGNLLFWYEIKDAIIRLTDWYYSQSINEPINKETIYRVDKDKSPFRMYNSGIEFGIGWHKPEDFDNLGDFISFSSLRIELKA